MRLADVTFLDYVIIAVTVLSVLIGVVRGAVREMMSIVSWVASGFLALHFAPAIALFLPKSINSPTARLAVAFVTIMLVCLLLFTLFALLLSRLVTKSGLTGTDRVLGVFFGLARAVVILLVLALLAGLTPIPRERAWRHALLVPPLESLAVLVRGYLPAALADRIRYD